MPDELGPTLKVADILSRRGQTIYGRRTIVDLCARTGVALTSGYDAELGPVDSEESLMDFIIEYSKLNPAAKMTVLILSEIYGLSIPKELLGKRKRIAVIAGVLESLSDFTHDLSSRLKG
ncbi:MAG: hypothetical protein ACP6KW_09120 [Candidatus Thorarchaeota archaeon]